MATDTQSLEQLLELTRPELNKLAAKAGVEAPDKLQNKPAVAEAIVAASEQAPPEPPNDDDADGSQDDGAQEPDVEPEPENEQAAAPNDPSVSSGKSATVTYLGRPDLIAHDGEGNALEEDVYQGTDPWRDNRPVNIAVGDEATVSAEKAAQLDADFPGAFELS